MCGGTLEQLIGDQGFVRPLAKEAAARVDGVVVDLSGRDAVLDVRGERRDGGRPALELLGAPAGLLAASRVQLAIKRAIDIALSAAALLVLAPVLGVIAAFVKASSPGPVLFVQERIGRDGRPFRMLKFRSMVVGAHERRHEHVELNHHDGPMFKIRDDPRVTRVGRALRRLSLDELPQLLNVLAGSMTLVGPRPPLPEEFEQFTPLERLRLAVKPGVTCIWQVSGRSDLDFRTWVEMDLEYIRSWNLLLDIRLLMRTVPAVLRTRGAY